jgi:hypothetical protein
MEDVEQIAQRLYNNGWNRGGPGSREQDEALDIEANELWEALGTTLAAIRAVAYRAGLERAAQIVQAQYDEHTGDDHGRAELKIAIADIRAAAEGSERREGE